MNTLPYGIHHVTAITALPQENIDFYTGVLGLRLVKLTVNFDDPGSYHFYYGDGAGHPGTIMTFFAWPRGYRGRQGLGQVSVTSFAIPQGALGYWVQRLVERGVHYEGPTERFGEKVLAFRDPDGLQLELVTVAGADERPGWPDGPIPEAEAIRGIHGVTLLLNDAAPTVRQLERLGFRNVGEQENHQRLEAGSGGSGTFVQVRAAPGFWRGSDGAGAVHHVAYRIVDDEAQEALHLELQKDGVRVTPVLDRKYFHSIYFREPGGVLFEIATDPPGFTVDEPAESLGTHLELPDWMEPQRAEIEAKLPKLRLPSYQPEPAGEV